MRQAGSLIAHSRKWKLYERQGWKRGIGKVMRLFLSAEDQVEMDRLDRKVLERHGCQ